MKEDTPEQKEAIRQRQLQCKHSLIKGASDNTTRCVWCGVSKADLEQMELATTGWATPPQAPFPWMGGVP
jgi:hypothetical protein